MSEQQQNDTSKDIQKKTNRNILTVLILLFVFVVATVWFYMQAISDSSLAARVTPTVVTIAPPTRQVVDVNDLAPIKEQISTLENIRDDVQSIKSTLTAVPDSEIVVGTAQAQMEALVTQVNFEVDVQLNNMSSDIEDIDDSITSINRGISELENDFEIMSTRVGDAEIRLATLEAPITATAVEATRRAIEICILEPEIEGGAYPLFVAPSFESAQTGTEYITETENEGEQWIVVAQTPGTPNTAGHWWAVKSFFSTPDDEIAGYVPSSQVIEIPLENCIAKPVLSQ